MGPLVPDVLGNELNYIVALIIGIAFGFVLEQAGFSSSKKLVGVFYGYDFVVLRVFFTAAVTAMLGIITLSHFGLLDTDIIAINPTFLWSAIVGGVIMGFGFILGGYCPGTGVCAAAVGKIDGMLFMVGAMFGVLIFAEGYPWFETIYKGWNYGEIRIFDTLNMSQGAFAVLLTTVAVGAFWMTTMIETKVNKGIRKDKTPISYYVGFSGLAVLIAIFTIFMPSQKQSLLAKANDASFIQNHQIRKIDADETAFRIMDQDPKLVLIDVRDEKAFAKYALPHAVNIQTKNMFGKEWTELLSDKSTLKVFYSYKEDDASKAAAIASEMEYNNVAILDGGLEGFIKTIIDFKKPDKAVSRREIDTDRFRERASLLMPDLIIKSKSTVKTAKVVKKIKGGC
jgi:rhodanese-related sulfurtransferase